MLGAKHGDESQGFIRCTIRLRAEAMLLLHWDSVGKSVQQLGCVLCFGPPLSRTFARRSDCVGLGHFGRFTPQIPLLRIVAESSRVRAGRGGPLSGDRGIAPGICRVLADSLIAIDLLLSSAAGVNLVASPQA